MSSSLFIMLVDDNEIDIFIHKEVIKQLPTATFVLSFSSAQTALDYLSNTQNEWPQLILLDIEMPVMTGLDFLEIYDTMPTEQRSNCRVVLLSSSLNNHLQTISKKSVFDLLEKPLNIEKLNRALASVNY
jgi:response regulator of citrate/malate metabolism